ncbi:MAG: extracellular solute-binding protein [Limnochordia bacterium]|jgi:multiple sugar transport system substrate-binding protein
MAGLGRNRRFQGIRFFVIAAAIVACTLVGVASSVQLEFWECWGGHRTDWIKDYINEFEKAHPDITASVRTLSCSESDLIQKFVVGYAGGVAPDLIMFQTFDLVGFADKGMLMPIDDYMSRDGLEPRLWYESELASGRWNGKQYGLPVRAGGDANTIIYRNVDLFETAGLDATKTPETLDELHEAGLKLVRYDANGSIVVSPMALTTTGDYNNVAWIYAANGQFLTDDLRSPAFHQGAALDVVEKLSQINLSWHRSPGDARAGRANFLAGKAAMYQTGAWEWSYIAAQEGFNFAVGPRARLNTKIPYAGAHIGTWHYVIPAGSHADEAWLLLRWLATRRDTIGDFLLRQGRLAPIVSFNNNPEYLKINRDILALAQAMSMASPIQMLPISRRLMDIHAAALTEVVNGRKGSVVAMEEARRMVQPLLDEYWYSK